jgi:hypothetical protein
MRPQSSMATVDESSQPALGVWYLSGRSDIG